MLEWEGRVAPGQLKRSTLQNSSVPVVIVRGKCGSTPRKGWPCAAFSATTGMRSGKATSNLARACRLAPGGTLQQIYLSALIDDATRYVVHAAWYPTQDELIVIDSLRTAMWRYGVLVRPCFDLSRSGDVGANAPWRWFRSMPRQ